jgi:hypothetical protein
MRRTIIHVAVAVPVLLVLFTASAGAQSAPRVGTAAIGADVDLVELTLLRSSEEKAAVRIGGAIHLLSVGDRVGRTEAIVTEIAPGRLVLQEVAKDPGGKPVHAQIILRDGETGGRKFLAHLSTKPPVGMRPGIVAPNKSANGKDSRESNR